jgi:flagellar motor switch protein FliM
MSEEEDIPMEEESAIAGIALSDDGEGKPIFSSTGRRIDAEVNRAAIEVYNFRNPGFLRQGDLRQLETLHQKFIEHLSARLSTFLRMECAVRLVKFGSSTFSRVVETMKATSHVTLFQVEFLRGIGILDISLPLSLAIADRMLGGKGRLSDASRGLTEIEVALLEDVAQMILVEWTHQWPEQEVTFTPSIVGHDTSGRFLQTAEADVVHVMVQAEVVIGECIGQIQMGIPFAMVEPIVKLMAIARLKGAEGKTRSISWRSPFNGINVPVVAEWAVKDMRIGEVVNLKPGDVLEMNHELVSQTQIRLSTTTRFVGTVGVEDGRIAVQLTHRKNLE